jgi:hypothetical protein
MKFKSNHKIYCSETENTLLIHVPGLNTLEITDGKSLIADCIKLFEHHSIEEIYHQISGKYDLSMEELTDVVETLIQHNILKISYNADEIETSLNAKDFQKHDRQIKFIESLNGNNLRLAIKAQEKIKSLNIAVFGVGGVGSYISYGLAAMGVNKLTLIDHDSVELSNVSRQMLYNEQDVGKVKVEVAEKKLQLVNPEIEIKKYNLHIENPLQLEQCLEKDIDLLMVAADTPRGKIAYIADEVCHKLNIPFILGSPSFDNIFVGPLIIPSVTKSLTEIIPPVKFGIEPNNKIQEINERFIASVIDPYNAIAGKMMLAEVIKYFTASQKVSVLGKMLVLSTETWQLIA